ncbi:MAG: hypothetical protein U5P41_09230 [Gammaproteobacteria bacterium]|nr:hypothetical protein [Gammaproteobacteria bacterium]
MREVLLHGPGYDPYLTTGQDKALVLELMLRGAKVARADGAFVLFRAGGSRDRQNLERRAAQGKLRFLRKYWRVMDPASVLINLAQYGRIQCRRLFKRPGSYRGQP